MVDLNKQAPDFKVNDFKGEEISLSKFRGSKVLIVLNRGFIWPFCRKHMMQLHQDFDEFEKRNTKIIVIGPEKPKAFNDYWSENGFKFYGISDEKLKILNLYKQKVNIFKLGRMPGQFLLDEEGIVKYIHYGDSMKDIPKNEDVFETIDSL